MELQSIFDVPEHKLLRLCDTRWLSFESVANRVLEQWIVLQHFFIRAQFEEKDKKNFGKNKFNSRRIVPYKSNLFKIFSIRSKYYEQT